MDDGHEDAPDVPPEFQIYDSHKIDPLYQRAFTLVWLLAALLFFVLFSLLGFVRSVSGWWRRVYARFADGISLSDVFGGLRSFEPSFPSARDGTNESANRNLSRNGNGYAPVDTGAVDAPFGGGRRNRAKAFLSKVYNILSTARVATMWAVPVFGMDIGQLSLIVLYHGTVLLFSILHDDLLKHPNRPGYITVAQLPLIFLLSSKLSPLSFFLGPGYDKLNYLHRWAGRAALLAALLHGVLWMRRHHQYGLPMIRFAKRKDITGLVALSLLCILGITSLQPARRRFYQLFKLIHLLAVPTFAFALRLHTIHSTPYLHPALFVWGLDVIMRIVRLRIRQATLVAPDGDKTMTIIRVRGCMSGWDAGQHVRLRVLSLLGSGGAGVGGAALWRVWESHPLTIMTAPRETTCLTPGLGLGANDEGGKLGDGQEHELILGARVRGDWTRALNAFARSKNLSAFLEGNDGKEADVDAGPSKFAVASDEAEDSDDCDDDANPAGDGETIKLSLLSHNSYSKRRSSVDSKRMRMCGPFESVRVTISGPYGGPSFSSPISTFHTVLLIAGGSGITFALALLDDLIGQYSRFGRKDGEEIRGVDFVWYVRDSSAIRWAEPFLSAIASAATAFQGRESDSGLDLRISIYVTRSRCTSLDGNAGDHAGENGSSMRSTTGGSIPNCEISFSKPPVRSLLSSFSCEDRVTGDDNLEDPDSDYNKHERFLAWSTDLAAPSHSHSTSTSSILTRSLAVCAAGPESLTYDVKNACASFAVRHPGRRVECHTEMYTL